ncbi:uncharacterized protein LOC123672734 isoform X1 [Harmonia axyridis]|uniref:uncharacterized protein LOC123672734 isoform X1 n=2 Tax=Harmonia axyridis TaxID=115357 RepID=UPI001E278446|nr:uncharacterized protein LOC123672734 isoform X1 [Harmonia axyridis]
MNETDIMTNIRPDILSVNGILLSAKAKYGDMSKIIYKGFAGENAISYIHESLRTFLNDKKYLEKDLPNSEFKNYFEELALLLLVNCEFSKPIDMEEYKYFTYNIPRISKYVVTKVITNMKMIEHYCTALKKLPLQYSCEIFPEFVPILDKVESSQLLTDVHLILSTIATLYMNNQEMKHSDCMDMLLRNVPDFFFFLTRISANDATKLKKNLVYKRAGLVLEKLFDLLFFCHKNNMLEGIFIIKLIDSTTSIVRAVSLDMFIYWAEVDLPDGQSLQSYLAESAYSINVKYGNFKPAADLVQSLKPFAAKPKDIKELIHTADLDKIVLMVNRADENQKKWFQALLFSPFYSNKKAIECVYKWGQLCDEEDVSRILNQSASVKDEEPKKLALKCASLLSLEQLIVVVIRHFYKNGFVILHDNHQELVLWFNKLKDSELVTEENNLELLLFILANPDFAVHFILTECIKSEFYISSLHSCFKKLKDIWKIHDICLNNLKRIMTKTPPSLETSHSYTKLIQILYDINLITFEVFSSKIICPLLEEYYKCEKNQEMKYLLSILNNLELRISLGDGTKKFFEILLGILQRRTSFQNHNTAIQSVIQEVVHLILDKTSLNQQIDSLFFTQNSEEDKMLTYYKHYLCNSIETKTFFQYMLGDISTDHRTTVICAFVKILPACVQDEWMAIWSEVSQKIGLIELIHILKDTIILLTDFSRNQEGSTNFSIYLEALRYLVHQYGFILKTRILPLNNEENEIAITQSLVSLMAHFPENLKETEGLNIINSMMTNRSLKHLGNDQDFLNKICRIKNTTLCQVIASKILN